LSIRDDAARREALIHGGVAFDERQVDVIGSAIVIDAV
jgi:hypothetical protein